MMRKNAKPRPEPPRVLVVDIGGTHVKLLASGESTPRKLASGPAMTPARMMDAIREQTADWTYDVVSMGYPGAVRHGRIAVEPHNLAKGWLGYDFVTAFGKPVKVINDAALQALGAYQGGTMLFLGLGTGLGSALVQSGHVVPLELAHLPYKKKRSFEDYVGQRGLARLGKKRWRKHVLQVADLLTKALQAEELVIGGGNARHLHALPEGARRVDNGFAFVGGLRLWQLGPERTAPALAIQMLQTSRPPVEPRE